MEPNPNPPRDPRWEIKNRNGVPVHKPMSEWTREEIDAARDEYHRSFRYRVWDRHKVPIIAFVIVATLISFSVIKIYNSNAKLFPDPEDPTDGTEFFGK